MKRTILILGASGRIGAAVARAVMAPNTRLALHWRSNFDAASELLNTLEQHGCSGALYQSHLSSVRDCDRLVEDVLKDFGRIDGLAICSGTVGWTHWTDLTLEDWDQMFMEHCIVPMTITGRIVRLFESGGFGRVVYLTSISPKYGGSPVSLHYAAAKSAMESGMYGLSRIAAGKGICINGVRAGFVDTPQQRAGRNEEERLERIGKIPMGRAGSPEEIAAAFAFFLSEAAGYVTGEKLAVSGGD